MPIIWRSPSDKWEVIGVACFLVACVAFFRWAPWTTAITVAEADEKYPGLVDPNWRAVTVNHGQPSEWRSGTAAENPSGFATCTTVLGMSVAGFLYCVYRASDGTRRAKLTIGST